MVPPIFMNTPKGQVFMNAPQPPKDPLQQILEALKSPEPPSISTAAVVESLLKFKKNFRHIKPSSMATYSKRFPCIIKRFEYLPYSTDEVLDWLDSEFTGESGRYKQTFFGYMNEIFKHAVLRFHFPKNPLDGIEPPTITHKPIKTLTKEQFAEVYFSIQDLTEKAAWELTGGHGWRQVEARRSTAGDVRQALSNSNSLILIRGKHRDEYGPILQETLTLLSELAKNLPDNEPVLRSRRIRGSKRQPLGEDGMAQLIERLYVRAGLDFKGHDTRRTFATLVKKASGDECLAMRLIRDRLQGVNDRYIDCPPSDLVVSLERYWCATIRIAGQRQLELPVE